MLRAGLIGAVVGFGLVIVTMFVTPLCSSCVALVVGLGVGGLAGIFTTPTAGSTSAAAGAKAGAIAGAGSWLGQIISAVTIGFLLREDLIEIYRDIHIPPDLATQYYWPFYLGLSCLWALLNVGLTTAFGALGGLLWYQIADKRRASLWACPQCGKRALLVDVITVNQETGEVSKPPMLLLILGILAIIGGIGISVFAGWLAVSLLTTPLPPNANVGSPCVAVGFVLTIALSLIRWGNKTLAQRKGGTVKVIKYRCGACKYQWIQQGGVEGAVVSPSVQLQKAEEQQSQEKVKGKEDIWSYISNLILVMMFPILTLWYGPKYLIKGEYLKGVLLILIVAVELAIVISLL